MNVDVEKNVGLTTVYTSDGMLHAMVIRGVLESAGIPVMLSYESIGRVYPVSVGKIGQVDILVPSEWAEEAVHILEAKPRLGEVFSVPSDMLEEEPDAE
ncbi:MAG: putative signal transducing protein [Anaerolineales bacterium]